MYATIWPRNTNNIEYIIFLILFSKVKLVSNKSLSCRSMLKRFPSWNLVYFCTSTAVWNMNWSFCYINHVISIYLQKNPLLVSQILCKSKQIMMHWCCDYQFQDSAALSGFYLTFANIHDKKHSKNIGLHDNQAEWLHLRKPIKPYEHNNKVGTAKDRWTRDNRFSRLSSRIGRGCLLSRVCLPAVAHAI